MAGGFIAFRCSNFENTTEREQFRYLCMGHRTKRILRIERKEYQTY